MPNMGYRNILMKIDWECWVCIIYISNGTVDPNNFVNNPLKSDHCWCVLQLNGLKVYDAHTH